MALTDDDLKALRRLMGEEVRAQLEPMRVEMSRRFATVTSHLELAAAGDEKREQEYLSMRYQLDKLDQLERRVAALEHRNS